MTLAFNVKERVPPACCVTPSIVTSIEPFSGGTLDRVKSVVDPSPVKLSILLSEISNVSTFLAIRLPQKTSLDDVQLQIQFYDYLLL